MSKRFKTVRKGYYQYMRLPLSCHTPLRVRPDFSDCASLTQTMYISDCLRVCRYREDKPAAAGPSGPVRSSQRGQLIHITPPPAAPLSRLQRELWGGGTVIANKSSAVCLSGCSLYYKFGDLPPGWTGGGCCVSRRCSAVGATGPGEPSSGHTPSRLNTLKRGLTVDTHPFRMHTYFERWHKGMCEHWTTLVIIRTATYAR